jgi:hypothetical protein
MADHAAGDDIFVYTGGRAPQHIVNVIIDESVEEIDELAFRDNRNLKSVTCHDGLLKVRKAAFRNCSSLQRMKMPGVKIIEQTVFYGCENLTHVEFDKLETVGDDAFMVSRDCTSFAFCRCTSLKRIKLPKVKIIGRMAFLNSGVEDAEFGEDLETIGNSAFRGSKLRRIAIPLRDEMFRWSYYYRTYTQFSECPNLTTVDLVGRIHKTVASLHLQSWRNEMNEEIKRINQVLPSTDSDEKADVIRQWIQSVIRNIDHYKAEHRALLKEATTLLELALWKAKLAGFTADYDKKCSVLSVAEKTVKKAKIDAEGARKEARITSGADIIIKNVLPYLKME